MIVTLFRSELLSSGSSAASIKLETIMQSKTTFPKYEWLHNQWQFFRNLKIFFYCFFFLLYSDNQKTLE